MKQTKEPKIINPLDEDTKWGSHWRETCGLTPKQLSSIDELKRLITYKYSSVRIFSECSGYSVGKINCLMYGRYSGDKCDQRMKEIVEIIQNTPSSVNKRYEKLDYDTRMWIKMRLYGRFKNLQNFCRLFPEFSPGYVSHVFKGRKKYQCPRVQRLVQILNSADLQNL